MGHYDRAKRILLVLSFTAAAVLAGAGVTVATPNAVQPVLEGANDFGCVPSAEHPRPVILVHGTKLDSTAWGILAPELADEGFCVFAPNYGAVPKLFDPSEVVWGAGDIAESGEELAPFVDQVLRETGASQVDMVGHSQGGTVARQYMKFSGGTDPTDPARNKVHQLVTLGATNHGTTFGGLQALAELVESFGLPGDALTPLMWTMAGAQQLVGSPTLVKLNAGSDVLPGVKYTVIATRDDQIVTPPSLTFLTSGDSSNVKNEWVQDVCPSATTSHGGLITDPQPLYMVKAALDPLYAAHQAPPC